MVILKIVGKILLIPVWIIVAMIWLLVKAVVAVYSFAGSIASIGMIALIVGTVICYQDWNQIIFLLCIWGISLFLIFAGVFIEISLESLKISIGNKIQE